MGRGPGAVRARRDWIRSALIGISGLAVSSAPARSQSIDVPLAVGDHVNRNFVLPLLDLIAQAAGLRWQIEWLPFSRVLMQTEQGRTLGFGMTRTPARERMYAFSEPLFTNHIWSVARRERGLRIERLDDLAGLSVCVGRGISLGAAFDEARAQQRFQVESSSSDLPGRLRMLLAGRCDVMLASHRSADPWMMERRLRHELGLGPALEVLPRPLLADPVHMAVGINSPLKGLLAPINRALEVRRHALRELIESDR